MINIEFLSQSLHSYKEVRGFIESNLSNSILSDENFFKWSFEFNSNEGQPSGDILFASSHNQIVGILGLNKRAFRINGQISKGAETTNLYINSIVPGIASAMFKKLHSKFDVIIGASPSTKMILPLLNLGYTVRDLPRYIFIPGRNEQIEDLSKTFKKISYLKKREISLEFTEGSWDVFFGNEKNSRKKAYDGFARDLNYLKWRYKMHPYYKYTLMVDGSKSNDSYFIFREESVNGATIIRVVDLWSSSENMPALYDAMESLSLRKNALFLDLFSTISCHSNLLLRDNWIGNDLGNNLTLPYLFQPIEFRDNNFPKYQIFLKNDLHKYFDFTKFNLTKSDADLDRPTIYELKKYIVNEGLA